MITNIQLVKFAEAMLGHEYWYGTYCQPSSKSLLEAKRKQYPKYYDQSKYSKGWTCDGRKVTDCAGLIKGANWCDGDINATPKYNSKEDLSANGLYEAAKEKGNLDTLPNIPGIILWKNGHVAISLGDGKRCIEAKGHDSGVVVSNIKERPFTNWFKCNFIDYQRKSTINVTAIVDGVTYNGNIEEV